MTLTRERSATLAVPWALILVMLLAAGAVGVLAAALPALRAVLLNILQTIANSWPTPDTHSSRAFPRHAGPPEWA